MRLLVVGGNGFLGSAVCRAAVVKGWQVSSISRSGQPYQSPAGHVPSWTAKVNWNAASAHVPASYMALLPSVDGVVHTIGTLFENRHYKDALKAGDHLSLFSTLTSSIASPNPLQGGPNAPGSYERVNRDSALVMLGAFLDTAPSDPSKDRTFTYISAEDIFRPFVPLRYIETKREAERALASLCAESEEAALMRLLLVRPGLMYHAHLRPSLTPLAALLSLSASLQESSVPSNMKPSSVLRHLASFSPQTSGIQQPHALVSLASLLETHPMHVDQVARAICNAIECPSSRGVLGTEKMRKLAVPSSELHKARQHETNVAA